MREGHDRPLQHRVLYSAGLTAFKKRGNHVQPYILTCRNSNSNGSHLLGIIGVHFEAIIGSIYRSTGDGTQVELYANGLGSRP